MYKTATTTTTKTIRLNTTTNYKAMKLQKVFPEKTI
jgi:hypothetical protein